MDRTHPHWDIRRSWRRERRRARVVFACQRRRTMGPLRSHLVLQLGAGGLPDATGDGGARAGSTVASEERFQKRTWAVAPVGAGWEGALIRGEEVRADGDENAKRSSGTGSQLWVRLPSASRDETGLRAAQPSLVCQQASHSRPGAGPRADGVDRRALLSGMSPPKDWLGYISPLSRQICRLSPIIRCETILPSPRFPPSLPRRLPTARNMPPTESIKPAHPPLFPPTLRTFLGSLPLALLSSPLCVPLPHNLASAPCRHPPRPLRPRFSSRTSSPTAHSPFAITVIVSRRPSSANSGFSAAVTSLSASAMPSMASRQASSLLCAIPTLHTASSVYVATS